MAVGVIVGILGDVSLQSHSRVQRRSENRSLTSIRNTGNDVKDGHKSDN